MRSIPSTPRSPAEIVRAIESVHAGDAMLSPTVTRRLISEFAQLRPTVLIAGDATSAGDPSYRTIKGILAVGTATLRLLESAARRFYRNDKSCPLAYEPSGEDFLSPCLAEADFMRRVLDRRAFTGWLGGFMPGIPVDASKTWLSPGIVTDRSDPKLAHIDGLNLSRAWMLEGIASGLPKSDSRVVCIRRVAIGLIGWVDICRLTRAQLLARSMETNRPVSAPA